MMARSHGTAATTRQRKVTCPDCGYTVRMARSWMQRGLPVCPCGTKMEPELAADRAFLGMIGPEDMTQAAWNAICRENGWDIMRNRGQAARVLSGSALSPRAGAAHCAFPGCWRWVAGGAERCAAGHAQHADLPAVEAVPF
jgi:hypothetical protein